MRRRDFITLLCGAAAWPLAARAQEAGGKRRIGVLMNIVSDDPESQIRLAAFAQGLQQLGWICSRRSPPGSVASRSCGNLPWRLDQASLPQYRQQQRRLA